MSDSPEATDLRLVGRSDDGQHLDLQDTVGNKFSLRIGDTLRATVNQPRLSSVAPIDDRPTYSVKDIQARLRAGESMDAISRTTDWPLEKIEKFAGPILQERAYIIAQALKTPVKRDAQAADLQTASQDQLGAHGVNLEEIEWNTYRRHDGNWLITLYYPSNDGIKEATWDFDSSRGVLASADDSAKWIAGEERDPRSMRAATPSHGIIYNHENPPIAPRLVSVKEEIIAVEDYSQDDEELLHEQEEEEAVKDGVSSRPKLPSWDEIMFGSSSSRSDDE